MTGTLSVIFIFLIWEEVSGATIRKEYEPEDKLLAVVALFRHGERSPTASFPNDPYFKESYWPMGFGQLTTAGKESLYDLGQWFRKRYYSFLDTQYSAKKVYVRSTDSDRCLMSAYSLLAGLYPPKSSQMLKKGLHWQPIPVHTLPLELDDVLGMRKPCLRYRKLLNETLNSNCIKKSISQHADFIKYVSEHTGWKEPSITDISTLQINLKIYSSVNASFMPPWADKLDKKTLNYLAGVEHGRYTLTYEMKRLLTGPFWFNLLTYFDDVINNTNGIVPFYLLAAHDTTIVCLLNCMGMYDFEPPGFASAIIWELREADDGTYYINLLYKRSRNVLDTLCSKNMVDCQYAKFKENLLNLTLHGDEWEKKCNGGREDKWTIVKKKTKKPFFT